MADRSNRLDSPRAKWRCAAALCLLPLLAITLATLAHAATLPLCLYVSSYHEGHPWSDGIERGLRQTLGSRCEIASVYMDTTRHPSVSAMKRAALSASELARETQPDIILTSDDNAAQYLIVPYLLAGTTPVVFSGINWTIKEYGLPTRTITGIVEVAPLQHMLINSLTAVESTKDDRALNLQRIKGEARIVYLSGYSQGDLKILSRIDSIAQSLGSRVDSILVDNFDSWLSGFRIAQSYDLVIIGNNMNVRGFDEAIAKRHVQRYTQTLSVTCNDWMMDYSVLGFTRIAEEQGEWAGLSAIAILDGLSPEDIPVATNRKFENWLNTGLMNSSGLKLGSHITSSAKKYP